MHSLKVALVFLTRLPVPIEGSVAAGEVARAVAWFPVVGALVGLVGGAAYGLAMQARLPPLAGAGLALAVMVALTGALHEDGLADTADGLGGADRESRLAIMRDSRIGTFGALALVLSVLLRASAITAFGGALAVTTALVVAGAVSRAALPVVMATVPPARSDGLAARAGQPEPWRAGVAVGLALLLAFALLPWPGALAGAMAAALAATLVALACARTLGGHSGDSLGAVQQLAEIALLLALLASG